VSRTEGIINVAGPEQHFCTSNLSFLPSFLVVGLCMILSKSMYQLMMYLVYSGEVFAAHRLGLSIFWPHSHVDRVYNMYTITSPAIGTPIGG